MVAYRRKAISSRILLRLKQIFAEVCITFGASLREFSGEADHVHLLIEYPPVASDLIRPLKAVSSLKIRREFRREIIHLLWGKRFWTRSYCAISVGDGASILFLKKL